MSAVVPHESAALTLPGEHSEVALILPDNLSFGDVEEIFARIQKVDNSGNWWLGDVMVYCERHHTEKYSQLFEPLCRKNSRYRNCKNVSESVPVGNRRKDLSWSCHRAVASLDVLAQPRVLMAAAEYQWGSDEVGRRVAAVNAGDATAFDEEWKGAKSAPARSKIIDVPEDGDGSADDTPVMDAGAVGESLSAERGEGSRPETDGFEDIERMRKVWAKMTPDLHIRFLRSIMTADLFMQVAPDFQQSREVREETRVVPGGASSTPAAAGDISSSSHVEHTAPTAAPCEAPAEPTPAVSIPVQTPAGGGSHSEDPLEIPDFLKRPAEAV